MFAGLRGITSYLLEVAIILTKNFWNLEPEAKALPLSDRFFWALTIHSI